MPRTRGRAVNREAPADHVSAPEAAELLKVHPDSIRNWLTHEPPRIAGKVVTNTDTNRTEYWVMVHGDSEYPTLEEKLAERSQVATRGDVEVSEEGVGAKIDHQREELRAGQIEIYELVRDIADSQRRQAEALERSNRNLERVHADAEKDRAAMFILLEEIVRRGTLQPPSKAPSESEPEERKPWYRRWFS